MRNATCTTIAPTGTISIIAGCSSGIEPLFAVSFVREVMEGKKLVEINPYFQNSAIISGFYNEELMKKISQTGSVQQIKNIPQEFKKIFKTSLDIQPEVHVKMQAALQKYVDNAVSKTVNLPENAKPKDIAKIYLLAHRLGCKGITVYRYNSKPEQVLYLGTSKEPVRASIHYSGGCASGFCAL
jgi:ribonucleoside-diphosphate reductase alpha chain